MKLNIGIVEDNIADYNNLYNKLNKWAFDSGHILKLTRYRTGEELIKSSSFSLPEIFFMDIELNTENPAEQLNGIETAIRLRKAGYDGKIIFLTAFREYVFEGYNVNAFNYLIKPISNEALSSCMNKIVLIHTNGCYCFRSNNELLQIPYKDIVTFSKASHDVLIQTKNNIYSERASLNDIEKHLPNEFVRCHKSCIVNIHYIYNITGNTLKLSTNQIQSIGRTYITKVRQQFVEFTSLEL